MFAELPKLFDRNFAIGYLLPVAVVAVAYIGLLQTLNILPRGLRDIDNAANVTSDVQIPGQPGSGAPRQAPNGDKAAEADADLLVSGAIAGFALWFCAVVLLALNRSIIRLLEGYGSWNPARLFARIERDRFHALTLELGELKKERQADGESVGLNDRRISMHLMKAERFPDRVEFLLPTAFGNTVRAFEVYPRVAYGLDAIAGWSRLLAVVPKDFRRLIDDAKAQVDFWVNLWFLGVLTSLLSCAIGVGREKWVLLWPAMAALLVAWICTRRARNAAVEWGESVKGAFDVHRVALCRKLGYRVPASRDEEQAFWNACTQLFQYRNTMRLRSFDYLRLIDVAASVPGLHRPPSEDEIKAAAQS